MTTLKVYATTQHLHVKMHVHYGKLATLVEFTGGKLTSNGTTAATYSTSNETMQRFIEGSEEFKKGVIVLQRTIVGGNIVTGAPRAATTMQPQSSATEDAGAQRPLVNEREGGADGDEATVQRFERLADAKEWLNDMGVNTESIIKKAQAEQIAKGMGYTIIWT